MAILLSSGSNAHGQLANGLLDDSHTFMPCSFSGCPPSTLPLNRRVICVASGANHTLALLEADYDSGKPYIELWGCGDGSSGQLGASYLRDTQIGESTTIFRRLNLPLEEEGLGGYQYKFVSASWETTYLALSSTGKRDIIISMGSDDFGDLGVGGISKGKAKQTAENFHVVDFGNITFDGVSIELDTIRVRSLASGQHHVVAQLQVLLEDRSTVDFAVGWGTSRHGQLGSALGLDGRPIPFLKAPAVVSICSPADATIEIMLGSQHTVFLYASGKISGLGSNRKRQLQGLENIHHVRALGCTWNGTYMLVEDGRKNTMIMASGSHAHGQLGCKIPVEDLRVDNAPFPAPVELPYSSSSRRIIQMACGTEHVLVLYSPDSTDPISRAEVWGWGWNEHGNLGTGTTDDIFVPTKLLLDVRGSGPAGVWAGSGTSWIYCTE